MLQRRMQRNRHVPRLRSRPEIGAKPRWWRSPSCPSRRDALGVRLPTRTRLGIPTSTCPVSRRPSDLRVRLETVAYSTFDDGRALLRRVEAAYFLALLEMARWGLVELAQEDWLAEIEVRKGRVVDIDMVSEWAS